MKIFIRGQLYSLEQLTRGELRKILEIIFKEYTDRFKPTNNVEDQ